MNRPSPCRRTGSLTPATLIPALLAVSALSGGCNNRARAGDEPAPAVAPDGPYVDSEDVDSQTAVRAEELLIGRFPGVRVILLPGGGFRVRVWATGMQPGGEPLYVVDGVPVRVDPDRGIDWLNPADIHSMRVLKDVSEIAPWGVRGANGVVVIETKKGSA